MTDKSNDDNDRSVTDTAAGTDAGDDARFEDLNIAAESAETSRPAPRTPLLVALLALVLALAALAGLAWFELMPDGGGEADGALAEQVASLESALRARDARLATLEQNLASLESGSTSESIDVDALERRLQNVVRDRLQDRTRELESLPARIASLESTLTALRGISTGARDAWLLAEAEYYLQIGNSQLQLAGNPVLASLALQLADERLVELGDPGLTDVRRVLSKEIVSLKVLEMPDIEGTTLTLASLARVVESLPLQQRIQRVGGETEAPDNTLSGTDRALATLKNAMSDVVSVRRTEEAVRPLIAPESVYFLRANLSLQLQAARLALLRGEQALFQQSLDDATAWLREYYDTESTAVRSTLQTLDEVRQETFTRALPDVSASLRLLREYIAFIEAAGLDSAGADAEPAQ